MRDDAGDFMAHASELWLKARLANVLGMGLEAAQGFRAAADLWAKAADTLEDTAPAEAFRQIINRISVLMESGDLPRAEAATMDAEKRLAALIRKYPGKMAAVQDEWLAFSSELRLAANKGCSLRTMLEGEHYE